MKGFGSRVKAPLTRTRHKDWVSLPARRFLGKASGR